jgi:phosphoglycerol transferase MdoB-like AlkP superfamily enzyme
MLLLQGPLPFPSIDAPVLQFPYLVPSAWGMGIFFTSPALLLAFRASKRERMTQASWLAILFVLASLSTYYGVGWVQFGYRYALDFIPFALLLVARSMSATENRWARALIIASVLVNLWGAYFIIKLRN